MLAAGLLCAMTFQAGAQAQATTGGGGGRGGMLTQDQRTKMRESLPQSELTPLSEKLVAAQKEAVKAALAANADAQTVKGKIDAVTKIQAEIAMLRFKGVKAIASTLTDEQKTQMEASPGMAYNQLFGTMGGGRGGMGGGRRNGGGGGGNN